MSCRRDIISILGLSDKCLNYAVQEELKDFFPTLLDFAGALTSAAPDPSRKAGAALYMSLFLQFESSYHRQVQTQHDHRVPSSDMVVLQTQYATSFSTCPAAHRASLLVFLRLLHDMTVSAEHKTF